MRDHILRTLGSRGSRLSPRDSAAGRPRTNRNRPAISRLESLEERSLLSTVAVTSLGDSGPGTLRSAILQANAIPGTTIAFAVTGTISLSSALPDLKSAMAIQGPGWPALRIQRASLAPFSIFKVDPGVTAAISGVTITGGSSTTGGGVDNLGTLTLIGVAVIDNTAYPAILPVGGPPIGGGGIANFGSLTVVDSLINNNSIVALPIPLAPALQGAGIFNVGNLTVGNSVIAGNTIALGNGGGIENAGGTVTVVNTNIAANRAFIGHGGGIDVSGFGTTTVFASSVINNTASTYGGGIANSGSLYALNSTISLNTANGGGGGGIADVGVRSNGQFAAAALTNDTIVGNQSTGPGGGISQYVADAILGNTIVASNTRNRFLLFSSPDDISGVIEGASSFNLIGSGNGMFGVTNGVNGNLIGNKNIPINPLLSPVGSNGGPTPTLVPLPGSPAIGHGSNSVSNALGLTQDQRGLPRIFPPGGTVDIGSVEVQDPGYSTPTPVNPQPPGKPRRRLF